MKVIRSGFTLVVILTAGFLFSSCGAKKISNVGSEDFSSRTPVEDLDSTTMPAAACNVITASFFTAGTMVYVDTAGNARNEALRLKLESLSSEFSENNDYFIQFFRWKANGGTPTLDNQPLEFAFEITEGRKRIQGTTTVLNLAVLQELAAGIKLENATLSNLLNSVNIILNLKDPKADYDAIKVVAYEKTSSNGAASVVEETDTLIPAFYADPRQYAVDSDGGQRPGSLLELHPFFSTINHTALSVEHYAAQARNLCWESVF